ncbi:aminoacyl-tRNA hydrolase [Methylocucumis oryzae]|uniref:Peptidyl-tRNA hydrolase n=1 Tax=Methylocucumis oryzae TaxID=1632867 RepID=A0A0F3IMB1_9GAMM|nr:aminoacyl-tRNA hydrolase [Methylocucumis oryzae]KJV07638.1 peptidyl-tRNA hydrolase [Methylocucumis oryzae]
MIKLLVGLGNPGRQYEKTRHNVGFLFLDKVFASYGSAWNVESKFQGIMAECSVADNKLLLLKPQTFMNRSGLSVGQVLRYFKLSIDQVLVIHDELDLSVGVSRLKKGGGHAGHNGLRDIIQHLGSNDFYRMRIGIGRPASGISVADYVLSAPMKEDMDMLNGVLDEVLSYLPQIVAGDISVVMNKLN